MAATLRRAARKAKRLLALHAIHRVRPGQCVTVMFGPVPIITASFAPGKAPVLQLAGVFQSPLPPIQETVAPSARKLEIISSNKRQRCAKRSGSSGMVRSFILSRLARTTRPPIQCGRARLLTSPDPFDSSRRQRRARECFRARRKALSLLESNTHELSFIFPLRSSFGTVRVSPACPEKGTESFGQAKCSHRLSRR